MATIARNSMKMLRRCLSTTLVASLAATGLLAQHGHGSEGVGTAHMEISCAPAVRARFDRALALLHNFWYARRNRGAMYRPCRSLRPRAISW